MPLPLLARGWLHGTFDPREGPAAWARGLGPGACSRCRASLALGMTPQSPRTHGSASNCRGASATSAESGARVFRSPPFAFWGPSAPQFESLTHLWAWGARPSRMCPAPTESRPLHPSPGAGALRVQFGLLRGVLPRPPGQRL